MIEQGGLVKFLKEHPNIKAYFYGNSNWNEFYSYHEPDDDVNLSIFRFDSPIKAKHLARDLSLLSFQLIAIDPEAKKLTVRESLWNTQPLRKDQKGDWQKSNGVPGGEW